MPSSISIIIDRCCFYMHGLRHKTIPTWDAMVAAFLRRFFYRYFLEGNHGRVKILNVEYIGNGQEEEELLGIERDKGKIQSISLKMLKTMINFTNAILLLRNYC